MVPHSHNDPGWLETESQYFKIRSKMIITNVVKSLEAEPKRRFQWVEMVYFREWWGEQDAATQGRVRALVAARRLIFLTGGLCMNDEAISHHGAVIDQMTWGHRFINETFGPDALPTVGWQIDAFGHGAGYTSLTAAMGIKAMIGQKIDFQDQARRAAAQELEFRWTADPTNHPNRSVFGHIMFGMCRLAVFPGCLSASHGLTSCTCLRRQHRRLQLHAAADQARRHGPGRPAQDGRHDPVPHRQLHRRPAERQRLLQDRVPHQLLQLRRRARGRDHRRPRRQDGPGVPPRLAPRVLRLRLRLP